jgi:hypothetical protein
MALNLSTLTSPATSGDVLAEALTTADFLEGVPVLRNLARGSQKGGDAEQSVALNQPKALPLIDGDGYLYLSGVSGNYARLNATIPIDSAWEIEYSGTYFDTGDKSSLFGDSGNQDKSLEYRPSDHTLHFYFGGTSNGVNAARDIGVLDPLSDRDDFTFKFIWDGNDTLEVYHNGALLTSKTISSPAAFNAGFLFIGQRAGSDPQPCLGCVKTFKIVGSAISDVDVDFTATNVRHGDTKFKCATGQVVTINQSGNDPATIIKKPVLRFDGANSSFQGLFANDIDGGYMFAAFSVLGDGGETYGRIFSVHNSASAFDYTNFGFVFSLREQATNDLGSYYNSTFNLKNDLFDDDNGDILHEVRSKSGQHLVSVNGSSLVTNSRDTSSVDSNTFNISRSSDGGGQAAIDLEYLALFPATITDAEANRVRDFINTRNNVFLRHDTDGYYFFDPLSLAADAPVASWNGQIVGSDNDANLTITQSTANSQPDRLAPDKDGMVVRFNDSNDHLIVPSGFVEPAAGSWQVVGTSLGTFAYRVDNDAVTELNLLGNLGQTDYRKAGDLYGIILLPESATGADIEAARSLLIDRGAADGVSGSSVQNLWRGRDDIVNFNNLNFTNVNNFLRAFRDASSLSDFPAIDASNGTNFTGAWQGTTALTSFPAGAKLGTSANNVNFESAFRSSGLTSFPALDLSKGDNFYFAWIYCPLSDFSADAKLGTNANLGRAFESTLLTSFQTPINTAKSLYRTWNTCNRLVDFSADVFLNWNPSIINSSVFHETWAGCSALSAISVQNILTSLDASGQHGTDDGTSTGNPLGDSGIDIDYNVATGSLSAATNTAVTSLKSKGWSIIVNNVTL